MSLARMPPWTDAKSADEGSRRHEWATRFRRRYQALGGGKADPEALMQRAYVLYDAPNGLGSVNPDAAAWETLREAVVAEGRGEASC